MQKIYVLKDPSTEEIRYVGKTKNSLEKRLSGHLEKSNNLNNKWYVANWIRSLQNKNQKPIIKLIGEFSDEEINDAEKYYIKYFKDQGCSLTNATEGGDGGDTTGGVYNIETARKKARKKTVKIVSKLKGTKQSPDLIKKRSSWWKDPLKVKDASEKNYMRRESRKLYTRLFDGYSPIEKCFWFSGVKYDINSLHEVDYEWEQLGINTLELSEEEKIDIKNKLKSFYIYCRDSEYIRSKEGRENARIKAKEQWENYSPEKRETQVKEFKKHANLFREKIVSGEIVDPRIGYLPWNKGIKVSPHIHEQAWETRRLSGFKSQKELINEFSINCGETYSKVSRTLKGEENKVSEESRKNIWKHYYLNLNKYSKITIKETLFGLGIKSNLM